MNSSSSRDPQSESGTTNEGGNISKAAQKIKTAATGTAERIKSAATDTATQLKDQAGQIVDERKEDVARRVDSFGTAIHDSAKSMERDDPNIAWVTHQAADRLQSVADYVRNRDFASLRGDVENLARRNPAVFFGGLFVAGIVLGNVLKATASSGTSGSGSNALSNGDEDDSGTSNGSGTSWSGASDAPSESALSSTAPADI